jgi:enoyl-CoA hydratase
MAATQAGSARAWGSGTPAAIVRDPLGRPAMSGGIDVRIDGTIRIITLDRPDRLNALDAAMVDRLLAEIENAHAAKARLLVFRGAGRSFCAGFDLGSLEKQSEGDLLLRFVRIEMLLQAIASSPARTMALAHGKVFGAGVDLVAACRYRVAAPGTSFRMPGLKFGLVLGTRRFAAIVGPDRATHLLEETRPFDADIAREMNFVHQLAEPQAWDAMIEAAASGVDTIDDTARRDLYQATGILDPDRDLAALVRSAARAGLKERLLRYAGR